MSRFARVAFVMLALAGCASAPPPPPPIVWIGADPTHLAVDKVECQREADQLDVNSSETYSDPRYGVASAMAAQIGRDNPLMNQTQSIRAAAFAVCMGDKGWKPQ